MLKNSESILGPFKKITFLSVPPLTQVKATAMRVPKRQCDSQIMAMRVKAATQVQTMAVQVQVVRLCNGPQVAMAS
jgi:hypothetical protein